MEKIKIKGKDYVMVNERLKVFRESEKYKGWSLVSEIVSINDDSCVFKAIITDPDGMVRATGHAQEDRASTMINKTSFVENCETSAWGRALGNLGIGIDESVASAEEVDIAIKKQEIYQSGEPLPWEDSKPAKQTFNCSVCDNVITEAEAKYSTLYFKKQLCRDCQKKEKQKDVEI